MKFGAAAFVRDLEGRILLFRRTYGPLNWAFPGGFGEPGETPAETAVRELRGETGLHGIARRAGGPYLEDEEDLGHFVIERQVPFPWDLRPDGREISEARTLDTRALPRPIWDFTVRRTRDALVAGPDRGPFRDPPRKLWA